MDGRCNEFRDYLEKTGASSAITNALKRLFELEERPANSIEFLRENVYPATKETIQSLREQFAALRSEFNALKGIDESSAEFVKSKLEDLQSNEECDSLLKQYLTEQIIDELFEIKTPIYKFSLLDCTDGGFNNPTSEIGVEAADPECYSTFAKLFNPIIEHCHDGYSLSFGSGQVLNWDADLTLAFNPDPDGIYIQCGEIYCSRALAGFPFQPKMSEAHFIETMDTIRDIFHHFDDTELQGTFYVLNELAGDFKMELLEQKLLFDDDPLNSHHWPTGRAVYLSDDQRFVVWINYQDHLLFKSIQNDGDIMKIYERICVAGKIFDEHLTFAVNEKYGFFSISPNTIGNTMQISITLKLEKLSAEIDDLKAILSDHHLSLVSQDPDDESIVKIKNKRCLGLTQFDTFNEILNGIADIVKSEKGQ